MATITVTTPVIGDDVTPAPTTCTAADKFAATGGKYILYYKNLAGGALTTAFALNAAAAPSGTFPAAPAGATNPLDYRLSNGIPISTDGICVIPDVGPYIDATGFVNLKHTGLTGTPTVTVIGPL
jgi:hypothetical protein